MPVELNVISVDDNLVNLMLIEAISKELGLNIKSFSNPIEAINFVEDESNHIDIILVDYMMPEMSGVDFIIRARNLYKDIPIIMITAVSGDNDLRINALEAGATEFLNKPLDVVEFRARLRNMTDLRISQLLLLDKALHLQAEVEKAVAVIKEREREALEILGLVAEYNDTDTGQHTVRVAKVSKLLAKELGQDEEFQNTLEWAAPLHDIGKVGIPDSLLNKNGPLTDEEFDLMRTHTTKGHAILKNATSEYLRMGAIVSLSHHEKWNGTGYPNGLKGEDIPLAGRIVAIADVFDAVSSNRAYKEAWDFDQIIGLITLERGKHFDPDVVDAFLKNKERIWQIRISQD